MCGIIGFQGRFEMDALTRGLALIAHRGPDDAGTSFDPGTETGLGHVRLAILDLSPHGHQPMSDPSGHVTLVFNGEIYNFRELRAELESEGERFHGASDTEVLLRLFVRHGLDALPRLDGMFAFAGFDRRTGDLWIARDRLGIKPLYFAETSAGVTFCSELKGLLPLVPELRELDRLSIARYLTYQFCPGDGTPLLGVKKLGAGEWLHVRAGKILSRQRWVSAVPPSSEARIRAPGAAVTELRQALQRSVHAQLVSDVPVGAFLSGGLDSSTVVSFAREKVRDLPCFTIASEGGPDVGQVDDLPFAREVARHLGVSLEVVPLDPKAFASDFESLPWMLDEPIADPAALNVWYISRAARHAGVKVLLSGAGGDDLFSGYRRHQAAAVDWARRLLPQPVRRLVAQAAAHGGSGTAIGRRVQKVLRAGGASDAGSVIEFFEWCSPSEVLQLIDGSACVAEARKIAEPLRGRLLEAGGSFGAVEQMLLLDQGFFLADHNLIYTDKMSMAAGIEVRVPLLSEELFRLSWRMSPRLKQRRLVGKWILKQAMRPSLPRSVIDRPKSGFGAPVRRWVRHDLRDLIGDVLSERALLQRGLFSSDEVRAFVDQTRCGARDGAYTVLALLSVELWCRRFLDDTHGSVAPVQYWGTRGSGAPGPIGPRR
jgi:asparagine synthase (glutamine-hydrolysing)